MASSDSGYRLVRRLGALPITITLLLHIIFLLITLPIQAHGAPWSGQLLPNAERVHPAEKPDGIFPRQAIASSSSSSSSISLAPSTIITETASVTTSSDPLPTTTFSTHNDSLTPPNLQPTCGFEGDDNTVGLGIRIGYYIQWIATVAGSLFSDKDFVSSAFQANAIFNIGMLAGLVYSTITRPTTYAVEPVIVLGFSVGGFVVGLLDPRNVHHSKNLKSLRTRLVFLLSTGAMALPVVIYWTWYAWYGIDAMYYTPCSTYAFIFVRVNIRQMWYRLFLKIATSLALVGFLILGITTIILYRTRASEIHHEHPNGLTASEIKKQEASLAKRSKPTWSQFIVVIPTLCICAASVEFGIIWNHIEGVNTLGSTGQLIPLAMGVMTCLQVVGLVMKRKWKKSRKLQKQMHKNKLLSNIVDIVIDAHSDPLPPPPPPPCDTNPGEIRTDNLSNTRRSGTADRKNLKEPDDEISPISGSSTFGEKRDRSSSGYTSTYLGESMSEKDLEENPVPVVRSGTLAFMGGSIVQLPPRAATGSSRSIVTRSTSSASTKGRNKLKKSSGVSRRNT